MARPGFGLFAGYDLESYASLRKLAIALQYWISGGRNYRGAELRRLTKLQQGTVEILGQRMASNPLLTQIIMRFLQAPRPGGRYQSPVLLATGRDLRDYAIPAATETRAAAYQDATIAWQKRSPLQPPGVHTLANHAALHELTQRVVVYEGRMRTRGVVIDDYPTDEEEDEGGSGEGGMGHKKSKKRLSMTVKQIMAEAASESSRTYIPPATQTSPPGGQRSTERPRPVDEKAKKMGRYTKATNGRANRKRILHHWLQSEKETVLVLIQEQLETHGYLGWDAVANSYNKMMAGVTQCPGEKLATSGRWRSGVLKEARKAPVRNDKALRISSGRWKEYHALLAAYLLNADADKKIDEEDEINQEAVADSEYGDEET